MTSRRAFLASVAVAPVVLREMRATTEQGRHIDLGMPPVRRPALGSQVLHRGAPRIEHGRALVGWVYLGEHAGWKEEWLP